MDRTDAERLRLLDRIAERVPELDLDRERVEWIELPDGVEVLPLPRDEPVALVPALLLRTHARHPSNATDEFQGRVRSM